jgi:hypothetical protein
MSTNGFNVWKKQKPVRLELPSGAVAYVRRPSPDVGLRSGRVAEFFQSLDPQDQEAMWDKLEAMTDEEADRIKRFIREMVLATIVSPKVHANPKGEELGLDDIPSADFWRIFNWGSTGGATMPVKVGEGEVTVEAVDTFSEGQGSGVVANDDGADVQPAAIPLDDDQRSLDSVGV